MEERLQHFAIPVLSDIPWVGPLLFDHGLLIYCALILPFLVDFLLFKTGIGLRILAAGDGPEALDTAGVSVPATRFFALILAGGLISLGGSYLAIVHSSSFTRDMTAGRGFIALAAVIFGKWRPIPAFFSCLFFGMADAMQILLQSQTIFGMEFPVQALAALPYIVTLTVLVGFVGSTRPPLAIGKK